MDRRVYVTTTLSCAPCARIEAEQAKDEQPGAQGSVRKRETGEASGRKIGRGIGDRGTRTIGGNTTEGGQVGRNTDGGIAVFVKG